MPALSTPPDHPPRDRRRKTSRVLSLGLASALALGGLSVAGFSAAAPALASAPGNPLAPAAALAAPETGGLDLSGGDSSLLSASTEALAPGLVLTDFRRLQPAGWVTGHVMTADLSTPTLSLDVLDSGTVSGGAPVTQQIAGTGAVAAVNGDYFDINYSGAPVGTNVSPSEGLRSAASGSSQAFTLTDGVAAIQALTAKATLTVGADSTVIAGVNTPGLGADAIGYYTAAWGAHPLSRPLGGPDALAERVASVTVKYGVVTAVSTDPASVTGPTAIADGTGVLIGREAGADRLAALTVGQRVDIAVGTSADVDLAVSGSQRLIVDGVQTPEDQVEAGRTAVGVSRDGTHVTVVSIDGRAGDGRGMTIQELGDLMLDLGAYNAVNLDGGGSTTLAARRPGTTEATIVNRPSDGTERVVANSLAFFSSAPSGSATDVRIAPTSTAADADAVFPGLHRTVSVTGLDDNLAGVPVEGSFASADPGVSVATQDGATGVVTGVSPGTATVSYAANGMTATTPLRVLGDLVRVKPSSTVVALPEPGQSATVTLTGLDGDGFGAPLETADVTVTSGPDVTVTAGGLDSFTIAPTTDSGSATVTFTAGGKSVDVAVTIGYRSVGVADFADGSSWTTAADRATGTTVTSTGPSGEPALTLSYDFTQSTGTRGYYAVAPEMSTPGSIGRTLEGQPQALTLWIKGDGNGTWPRIQIKNGAGTVVNLDGPFVDWTGWKQARFTVPAGTPYPLSLQRIRMLETKSTVSYHGEVSIADLEEVVAPDVEQPVTPVVYDPVVVTDGTVADRPQHIAVMSDAQFVARNPDSDLVAAARATLRQIVAAHPDYLVIDGDFVDEASPADIALAKKVLDEEVGDSLPYIYVPGNHEVMGGPISNFEAVFGATHRTVTVGHTKIITLNSSAGSFRASGLDQLEFLDDELASAADDPNVTGVLVFNHHPADDPLPDKASQLGDRFEAAQFIQTLSNFRDDSGKSIAAVNGHVGVFDATSYDGVSRLINGNAGKSPAGTPSTGGFTGWTMLGLNPGAGVVGQSPTTVVDRTTWMQAETKPRVDAITLDVPAVMTEGETVTTKASFTQDGAREVPVAWPVSAQWSGEGTQIDDGAGDRLESAASGVLRLNPATGELTAVAAGTGSVTVTVNGVSSTVQVTVDAAPGEPGEPGDPGTPGGPGTPGDPGTPGGPGDGSVPPAGDGNGAGDGTDASGTDSSTGDLASTGLAPMVPVMVALLALLGGTAVVMIRRRRSAQR